MKNSVDAGNKENSSSNSNTAGIPLDVNAMSETNVCNNPNGEEEVEASMIQEAAAAATTEAASDGNSEPVTADGISELAVVPSVCVEVEQDSAPPMA